MSDSALRKRKESDPPSAEPESLPKSPHTTKDRSSVSVKSILALLLLAAGYFVYKNPSAIQPYLDRWSGISDSSLVSGDYPPVVFTKDVEKQEAIIAAFKHAWHAYERDAMGADEYHPLSRTGSNLTAAGGIGYTVVDSIDTMIMMGLKDEYKRARKWIAEDLSFNRDGNYNTFEITIRVLGGLLSSYHLTGDKLYLERAQVLGDLILPAFDTQSGLPLSMINLAKKVGVADKDNNGFVSIAEASTLQLELRYLSWLTDEDIYWDKAEKVMEVIHGGRAKMGLASIFMRPEDGKFALSPIRLGSRGDSYYEYLLKQYLQTNMTERIYHTMYTNAMDGVHKHLVQKTQDAHLVYTSELVPERNADGEISWRLVPKQDHLVCFLGGSLMLGAVTTGALVHPVSVPPRVHELTPTGQRDWTTGVELVRTCMKTHETATGLSPEIAHFRIPSDSLALLSAPDDWYIKGAGPDAPTPYDARYILRPETVESLFVAYRLTGDQKYRDYGWAVFEAIEKHCRVAAGGYASVLNVDRLPVELEDKMETFLMSETLKYLYLLFDDDTVLPLSEYVFNTEAHPLPIFHPSIRTGFS